MGIQVLSRAVTLLRALEGRPDGLSLSHLAERSGLPRSTVHRLVAALEAEGLLAPASPRGRVRLGHELVRLAEGARLSLETVLEPIMRGLFEQLNETIDLSVLDGTSLRFVAQLAAPHRLRAVSAVGATFPLHCTAHGKAVLAAMPPQAAEELLPARLARFTSSTHVTRSALRRDLRTIRQTGIGIDRDEHTEGISAVAFAVRDTSGTHAAVSVPMPTARFEAREDEILAAVAAARLDAIAALMT